MMSFWPPCSARIGGVGLPTLQPPAWKDPSCFVLRQPNAIPNPMRIYISRGWLVASWWSARCRYCRCQRAPSPSPHQGAALRCTQGEPERPYLGLGSRFHLNPTFLLEIFLAPPTPLLLFFPPSTPPARQQLNRSSNQFIHSSLLTMGFTDLLTDAGLTGMLSSDFALSS